MDSRRTAARISAVLMVTALGIGLAGCAPAGNDGGGSADSASLTIAANTDNNSFDRTALEIGNRVHYWMPVYDTLLVLDPEAELQANLATEWSYNDDNTILSLTLRDDVEFTDGAPFNAAAVQANLEALAASTGQNSYMAQSIASYKVVDASHIDLVLSAPDPGLLGYLAVVGGAMASPETLGAAAAATTPVGSGPYVLDSDDTVAGSRYVYERNEDYWNQESFPYDEIVITPLIDNTARLNALKSGQADVGFITATQLAEAEGSGLEVEKYPTDWQGLIIADRAGETVPALADVRVRQAINMAIDRQALLDGLLLGEGEVTAQTFNTLSPAFDPALDDAYPYDVDGARELMAEAGYADGFDVTMPDLAGFPQVTPILEQQLGELGIRITFEKVPVDSGISELLSGRYPMFFFLLGSQSPWQDMRKLSFTSSPWNTAKVEDPEMDALLSVAQAATGSEQEAAFQDINAYMVENAWFSPWFRSNTLLAHSADVIATPQAWNVVPWIRNINPAS